MHRRGTEGHLPVHNGSLVPKVSVVIPTYNYAHFLPEAVQSVLAQTFPNFELIIVDDGSTDNTPEVAKRFLGDPRVRYVRQENRGLSAARNTGIREARGKYVAFLDPDDLWLPEKLEKQVALVEKDVDIALAYCTVEFMDTDGAPLPHVAWPHPPGAGVKELLYMNWVVGSGSSVLVRKAVFEEAGLFNESLRGLEDIDMWLRILHGREWACEEQPLARIRRHGKSMQSGKAMNLRKREAEYLRHLGKALEMFPDLRRFRKEALHHIYEGMLYTSFVYGKKKDMLRYYIRAGAFRPSFLVTAPARYLRKYFLRGRRLS